VAVWFRVSKQVAPPDDSGEVIPIYLLHEQFRIEQKTFWD
jgi:hypothetical protein